MQRAQQTMYANVLVQGRVEDEPSRTYAFVSLTPEQAAEEFLNSILGTHGDPAELERLRASVTIDAMWASRAVIEEIDVQPLADDPVERARGG